MTRWALLLLLAAVAAPAAAASYRVEHSLDGGKSWGAAGDLTVVLSVRWRTCRALGAAPEPRSMQGRP